MKPTFQNLIKAQLASLIFLGITFSAYGQTTTPTSTFTITVNTTDLISNYSSNSSNPFGADTYCTLTTSMGSPMTPASQFIVEEGSSTMKVTMDTTNNGTNTDVVAKIKKVKATTRLGIDPSTQTQTADISMNVTIVTTTQTFSIYFDLTYTPSGGSATTIYCKIDPKLQVVQ